MVQANKNSHSILLIDDEADILDMLSMMIESFGYSVITADNCTTAKELILEKDLSMCITDMNLPDGSGIDIIKFISKNRNSLPVSVFTAHGNVELAVECLKLGAFDFLSKPVLAKDLKRIIEQGTKLTSKIHLNNDKESPLLGNSQAMANLRNTVAKIAKSQAPAMISGASGTGKELAARQIHALSSRYNEPFIAINCGAIPKELVESEFFGYKKGSFSGAVADKIGLFQAADKGTLFLDEIADLPLEMQVKLLRAIQEKKIRQIGDHKEKDIDVRIVSATHKNLEQEVVEGRFREDLFFRINVIPLNMPKLTERIEDIPILCDAILSKLSYTNIKLSEEAIFALQQQPFPGNVRELENIIERACAMCDSTIIEKQDLLLQETNEAQQTSASTASSSINTLLEQTEQQAIKEALKKTNGNKTKAAELLGISFRSLRYKLTKFDQNT